MTLTTATTLQPLGNILHSLELPQPVPSTANTATCSSTSRATNCQTCSGLDNCLYSSHRGFSEISDPKGTRLQECRYLKAWKASRLHSRLLESGNIPGKYRHLSLKDYRPSNINKAAVITILEAVKNEESIYIQGDSGTGKTLLMSILGSTLLNRGKKVIYTTAAELALALRYNSEDCEARLQAYQRADVLILEDLGAERVSEYSGEQLSMVLEGRRRNDLPTLITSEEEAKAIGERYTRVGARRIKHQLERLKSTYLKHLPEEEAR